MYDLGRWDPFQEMVSLRDAMNRLMEESFLLPNRLAGPQATETGQASGRGTRVIGGPTVDILDQDNAFEVRASLPGVRPEDVRIQVQGNQVTLSGQTREEHETTQGNYLMRERRAGQFSRTFILPTEVSADGAEASFENGILTLRLPKSEAARPRQIPIRAQGAGQQRESGQVQASGQSGQSQTPGQMAGQGQPETPIQG